jgi:hypothetical protein
MLLVQRLVSKIKISERKIKAIRYGRATTMQAVLKLLETFGTVYLSRYSDFPPTARVTSFDNPPGTRFAVSEYYSLCVVWG